LILVQEDPTCLRTIKPVHPNCWACALQRLKPTHPRACALQQEKPPLWEAHTPRPDPFLRLFLPVTASSLPLFSDS